MKMKMKMKMKKKNPSFGKFLTTLRNANVERGQQSHCHKCD
jgi:hypothetical protein